MNMQFIGHNNEYIMQVLKKCYINIGKELSRTEYLEYKLWSLKPNTKPLVFDVDNNCKPFRDNDGTSKVFFLGLLAFDP